MKSPESIARLGNIMQMAYVPADLETALNYWTRTIGAGPFFAIEHVKLDGVLYRGQPLNVDFSMMLGYWGEMQIELIRQHNDAQSIFSAWRNRGGEGLHHVCVLVDDMPSARSACAGAGLQVAQEARVPGGGEVIYVDAIGGPASFVEILKPSPGTREFFKMMRDAHSSWDGKDPVRKLG